MRLRLRISSRVKVLLFIAALFSPSVKAESQITTHTALPVSTHGGILRIQTKVLRSSGDPTQANRELTVVMIPLVLVYGVTPKLAAFGIVPVLNKKLNFTGDTARAQRSVSGLADIQVFLRYTVFQRDVLGATLRLAPFAGTRIPTGSRNASDTMGRLPPPLQLGSGAWSPFVGAVLTRQTFTWQLDLSSSYRFTSTIDGFRFGNEARFDVASKLRLLPRNLGAGLPSFLYANLESNLIWNGKNEINGVHSDNSGGTVWYVDPGFQFISRRIIIETALQIPIVQKLNGVALKNDFIFVISFRIAY